MKAGTTSTTSSSHLILRRCRQVRSLISTPRLQKVEPLKYWWTDNRREQSTITDQLDRTERRYLECRRRSITALVSMDTTNSNCDHSRTRSILPDSVPGVPPQPCPH